ncbi:MAG: TonB-dependent receptor [Deltaproteobacteria bacterium]|nr:TonB-dependent receptor [Deltaproteobacteria bacterium]
MRSLRLVIINLLCLSVGIRPALGDPSAAVHLGDISDISMEDLLAGNVVVSATKTAQKKEEAPAIVSVVTRADIQRWGYRSVAEVLSHAVGFYIIDDHALPNTSVRGVSGGLRAESGLIKVLIDGRPVAFRSTSGNWLGPELVPLTAVERIEIIRGPASALYGADAFLGVVNIVTRQAEKLAGAEMSAEAGYSGDHLGGGHDVAVGVRRGDFEILVSSRAGTEDRSGIRLPASSPAPNLPEYSSDDPVASGLTLNGGVGLIKLTYHLDKRNRVTLTGHISAMDRGAEFAEWTQLANGLDDAGRSSENRISLVQGFVDVGAQLAVGDDVDFTLNAMAFKGRPTDRDRIDVGSEVYYVKRDFGYMGLDLQAEGRWRTSESLTLLGGMQLILDEEQLPSNLHILKMASGGLGAGDIRETTSTRQGSLTLVNPGTVAQAVWTPPDLKIAVTGGLRYDYHNIYGHQVSGRAAVVVEPKDHLYVKLLYGSAFKAPSPLLLYGVPFTPGDIIGNRELKPQRVHTIESQVTYRPVDAFSASTGLAYNLVVNKAEFTLQGINRVARNVSEVHGLSWESQLVGNYEEKLWGYLNVGVLLAARDLGEEGYRSDLVGEANEVYPPVIVQGGLQAIVPKLPVRVGLELTYAAPRRASDTNILENGAPYELDSVILLDQTISTVGLELFPKKQTVLTLIGRNLLGSVTPDPGFSGIDYPRAPRLVMLQARQEL